MWHLFVSSLFRHTKETKTVSALLLVGLYIAVLCMSMMLGNAMAQYETTAGRSEYATLTFDPGVSILNDMESFLKKMEVLYGDTLSNILLLSTCSDDTILIGWEGTEGQRWFPFTMGRFFTKEELLEGELTAFVSDSYVQSGNNPDVVPIHDMSFQIIGTGWIDEYNIRSGISSEVAGELFGTYDPSRKFLIVPAKLYFAKEIPELICIHFDYASRADLIEYQKSLEGNYPDSSIYLPDLNSNKELISENIKGIVLATTLGVIACITIIQLMSQWIQFYRKEMIVYHTSGLTRAKCTLLLWGHWTVFFVIASCLAIMTHFISLSFLSIVEANYMPAVPSLLIVLGAIYILTLLFSYKFIMGVLDIQDGGEAA